MLELSDDDIDRAKKVAYLALSRVLVDKPFCGGRPERVIAVSCGVGGKRAGRIMSRQGDTGVQVVGNVLDHLHSLVFDGV